MKRIQRARLRRIMRGYRVLKASGQFNRIAVVKHALTEHPLNLTSQHFSSFVMGCGASSGEIVVRQYLLNRIGGLNLFNLNGALLLALSKERGRVVYPLAKEWREILVRHGFEVAHFRSALLWQLYVCALLLYGVAKIGKIAIDGITSRKRAAVNPKSYVYFAALGLGNLPQKTNNNQSHDIVSWYLQWPGRKPDIGAIHHSVANSSPITVGNIAVEPQRGPLPVLAGWKSIINYAIWGLGASVIAALDCLRGRWWHALLLNQAALAAQARILPVDSLASEYLFHNSSYLYRPLWTYDAERRGSTITLYFYSTNCELFKEPSGYQPLLYGWQSMSWPRYLVWDEYQADFVRRAIGAQAIISVVGPIWFQSSNAVMPRIPFKSIAVFDVTPARNYYSRLTAYSFNYYTPDMAINFVRDIHNTLSIHDAAIVWKQKREIGRLAHPKYRRFIETVENEPNFIAVDPNISAFSMIAACAATISMPFTSTALMAKAIGKPSIYYDPSKLVSKDDRAAHGIEIISGPDELADWLNSVFETKATENTL